MIYEIIEVEVGGTCRDDGENDNTYRDIDSFGYHKNRV